MPRRLTDEEKKILKNAMRDVVPLSKHVLLDEDTAPAPAKKIKLKKNREAASPPKQNVTTGSGKIDKPTMDRVKRGEFAIDARIDLHGLTLEQAHQRLVHFIESQHHKGARCVLVITGKGGKDGRQGALQRDVPRWLALSDMARRILMVSSARPQHGGQGALYVLLRRRPK